MKTGIKLKIERGEKAFKLYIQGREDELQALADEYQVKLKTLKSDMSSYSTRVLEPKPTEDELVLYRENVKKKYQRESQLVEKEKEAFSAFLETTTNPSAIVDLAFKLDIDPERVRINAFNYAKRTVEPKPTSEELETFNAINQNRRESFQKGRTDFSFAKELINLNSTLVADYLNKVIDGEYVFSTVINKIDLYIKYHSDETENIEKLSLIKSHLLANESYINEERRKKSMEVLIANQIDIFKQKVTKVLEEYLIGSDPSIESLLILNEVSSSTFNKYLKLFEVGTPKEKLLANQFHQKQTEEIKDAVEMSKLINYYLDNGIKKIVSGDSLIEGKFNILDYYLLINLPPKVFMQRLYKALKEGLIYRRELNAIDRFFSTFNFNNQLCTLDELLACHYSYNNMTIEDEDTKRSIIRFLEKHDIPLSLNIYYIAAEDYLKGYLNLDNLTLE